MHFVACLFVLFFIFCAVVSIKKIKGETAAAENQNRGSVVMKRLHERVRELQGTSGVVSPTPSSSGSSGDSPVSSVKKRTEMPDGVIDAKTDFFFRGRIRFNPNGLLEKADRNAELIFGVNVRTMQACGHGWGMRLHPEDFARVMLTWLPIIKARGRSVDFFRVKLPYRVFYVCGILRPSKRHENLVNAHVYTVDAETYAEFTTTVAAAGHT